MNPKTTNRKLKNNFVVVHNKEKNIGKVVKAPKISLKLIILITVSATVVVSTIATVTVYLIKNKDETDNTNKNSKNSTEISEIVNDLNVKKCDIGYFLPTDSGRDKFCQKCQVDNCAICFGTKLNNECTSCQTGFNPITKNNITEYCTDCETGNDEKCLSCDFKLNQCSNCNPGYFMPEDDETKKVCKKCSLDKCIKCSGTKNYDICHECIFPYKLTNGNCIKVYTYKLIYKTETDNQNGHL